MLIGPFKHVKHVISYMKSLLPRLHAVRIPLNALNTEEISGGACRKHQIIVWNFPMVGEQDTFLPVNTLSLGHEQIYIFIFPEERANWKRYLVSGKHRC